MKADSPAPPSADDVVSALRVLATFLATTGALAVQAQPPVAPALASAASNPLGSRRAFLDAAKLGRFHSWMVARKLVADWSEVETYARTRKRQARPRAQAADENAALLARAGARRVAANDARPATRRRHASPR